MAGLIARDEAFLELDRTRLLAILRLRVDVFVVEQACAYHEIDGRDELPSTRHVFIESVQREPEHRIACYLRLLDAGDVQRIGRVVTAPAHRGEGLAGHLVDWTLQRHRRPTVLDAQSHLVGFYGQHGFVVDGEEFLEDGIPHIPMHRGI